jgi:hypothetical protein
MGLAFGAIVGWVDLWTIVFAAIIVVFLLTKPFGNASGE